MNDVPLVKDNKINDINTSIIAIKKQLKQLNEAVGLIDIPDMPNLSLYIKKSDVVNTVTSGDMHPVTSNAVARNNVHAIKDYWCDDINNPIDVLSTIESYGDLIPSMSEEITIRIGSYATNSPYGVSVQNCDIFYTIKKINGSNNNWIRVIACDVRSNQMWENAKINGTWDIWYQLQRLERVTLPNSIISNTIHCDWANVDFRNGWYHLYGRFYQTTPITISEGAVIGNLNADYYMNPSPWDVITTVYNFQNGQTYLLFIRTNGEILIYGVGTQTIAFDFYIDTTYCR